MRFNCVIGAKILCVYDAYAIWITGTNGLIWKGKWVDMKGKMGWYEKVNGLIWKGKWVDMKGKWVDMKR